MSKKFRRFLAPVAATVGNLIAPGIGGVIGGALGGAASGDGLKGALTGGLSGGAIGFAPQIGAFANSALGAGLSSAGQTALGGALGGAAAGGLTGGGSGALTGALTGGLGGYLSNGGLGDLASGISLPSGVAELLPGTVAGAPLANGIGPTQGSGLAGLASGGGLSGLTSLIPGGGGGLTSALSGLMNYGTQSDIEKKLLQAQGRAEQAIAPYAATGLQANQQLGSALQSGELGGDFNFEADPGYQFRKAEGEAALQRAQSARGGVFSGEALREAAELNQQLANQAYQDAYQRDLARQQNLYGMLSGTSGQGQRAAGGLADVYGSMGDIRANALVGRSNALTGALSGLMGGESDIVGYDAQGKPIYKTAPTAGRLY